jgi:hypothetical protein
VGIIYYLCISSNNLWFITGLNVETDKGALSSRQTTNPMEETQSAAKQRYDEVGDYHEGRAKVELNGKYGFIDSDGNVVVPLIYVWASKFSEGRASVELNYQYGFIDLDGNVVMSPRYGWASDFHEGRAIVKLNGKYGVIDLEGNEVVPLRYDFIEHFHKGRAIVELNGKFGFVDLDGNEVIPCWYTYVNRQSYGFSTNIRVSTHNIEHLYYDRDGNPIVEPVI